MIKEFAPAKVNLFLDILKKRTDGYHELGTVFQTIHIGDFLEGELIPNSSEIKIKYNTEQSFPLEKDLVYKTAKLLQEKFQIKQGASFYLEKKMPLGAGLGGGSADAAAAFRILNKLWNLNLSQETLETLSAAIGADVPFLIQGGTAFATGIGEKLERVSLNLPPYLLVATPECFVPTVEAYKNVIPSGFENFENFKKSWTGNFDFKLFNKFEESVLEKFPLIAEMKQRMFECGATHALMSGSGASVFAIYETEESMHKAAKEIKPISRFLSETTFLKGSIL